MLGRKVGTAIESSGPELFAPEVLALTRGADFVVLNLECCIARGGSHWPDPSKPFFFRAPPEAVSVLLDLEVDCVSLANNHALDYSAEALVETFGYLTEAGIALVGAGRDVTDARRPAVLEAGGLLMGVVAFADHPQDFAASEDTPGVAFVDLRTESIPAWLESSLHGLQNEVDLTLVTPHWGPNMTREPPGYIRATARKLTAEGATLVAGHSAHVFHGVEGSVLYDLGDFVDDYAVDPALRNDLGLLFLVSIDEHGPFEVEAVPLKLEFCFTRLAEGAEFEWIRKRFVEACRELGTEVQTGSGRLIVRLRE